MRNREGFALMELIIAVGVLSILAYGGTMTISRVVRGTQRADDQMTALRQVQNTGYWMSRDFLNAQNVIVGDDENTPQAEFVSIYWTDWETGHTRNVYYYAQDMSGGLKAIKRHLRETDSDRVVISDSTTLIGQGMVGPPAVSLSEARWRIRLESRSGSVNEAREYEVLPRSNV